MKNVLLEQCISKKLSQRRIAQIRQLTNIGLNFGKKFCESYSQMIHENNIHEIFCKNDSKFLHGTSLRLNNVSNIEYHTIQMSNMLALFQETTLY